MASELRVDRIIPVNGVPTGGGGGIIQVVQAVKTSQTESSAATDTRVDLEFTVSITPTRSDSKILISLNSFSLRTRSKSTSALLILSRKIGSGSFTDLVVTAEYAGLFGPGTSSDASTQEVYPNIMLLDSPNTTSSLTYKLEGMRKNGSANVAYNHISSGSYVSGIYSKATLTAMEVSG